jgi:long-chain acyl-CoA synthetase
MNDYIVCVSTSGSTGFPKAAVCKDMSSYFFSGFEFGPWNCLLETTPSFYNNSTLGFASILFFNVFILARGGTAVYIEKKCANYFEEMRLANPTFTLLSPMSFNKIYQAIQHVILTLPSPNKEMVTKVIEQKTKYFYATRKYTHPELDKVMIPFCRNFFGDKLKDILNVGAPINEEVLCFFRILTGARVVNAYGSCDGGGLSVVGSDTDPAEIIGAVVPWYRLKLIDVPEKNYKVTDKPYPRGEICLKGTVMQAYLGESKKTMDAFTPDGWYKTGIIKYNE